MEADAPISQRELITKREYNITAGGPSEFTDIRSVAVADTKVVAMRVEAEVPQVRQEVGFRGGVNIQGGTSIGYQAK